MGQSPNEEKLPDATKQKTIQKYYTEMKLWDKGFDTDKRIEKFTVGNDALLDVKLARYDITGTMAHIKMLTKVGLLEQSELDLLLPELEILLKKAENGEFIIEDGIEDVHSQVEQGEEEHPPHTRLTGD